PPRQVPPHLLHQRRQPPPPARFPQLQEWCSCDCAGCETCELAAAPVRPAPSLPTSPRKKPRQQLRRPLRPRRQEVRSRSQRGKQQVPQPVPPLQPSRQPHWEPLPQRARLPEASRRFHRCPAPLLRHPRPETAESPPKRSPPAPHDGHDGVGPRVAPGGGACCSAPHHCPTPWVSASLPRRWSPLLQPR